MLGGFDCFVSEGEAVFDFELWWRLGVGDWGF